MCPSSWVPIALVDSGCGQFSSTINDSFAKAALLRSYRSEDEARIVYGLGTDGHRGSYDSPKR